MCFIHFEILKRRPSTQSLIRVVDMNCWRRDEDRVRNGGLGEKDLEIGIPGPPSEKRKSLG